MYTLRHANEIRSMDAIDELGDMPEKVKPEEVKLAQQVMATFEGELDFAVVSGRIPGRACARSSTRRSRGGRSWRRKIEAPPKVVNLMDALRKSLDSISAGKKKTAAPASGTTRATEPRKRARA